MPVYDVGAVFGESVLACIINPLENRRGQNTILSRTSESGSMREIILVASQFIPSIAEIFEV